MLFRSKEWANMDLAIIPSLQESFGVSAVEAQACGTSVIISDVPGLMEATYPGKSSIVVPRNDAETIAKAIVELFQDNGTRINMGQVGREYVSERYEMDFCFSNIKGVFIKI